MKYIAYFLLAVVAMGCGSQSEPNPQVESNRVESAKKMREAFDRTGGNYEQMTAIEKEEFIKLFNGKEEDARRAWEFMKNPPGGPTQGTRPTGS